MSGKLCSQPAARLSSLPITVPLSCSFSLCNFIFEWSEKNKIKNQSSSFLSSESIRGIPESELMFLPLGTKFSNFCVALSLMLFAPHHVWFMAAQYLCRAFQEMHESRKSALAVILSHRNILPGGRAGISFPPVAAEFSQDR